MRLLPPYVHSVIWLTKAGIVLLNLNQDYCFLGRNFIKVRNIIQKDIEVEQRYVFFFFFFSTTFLWSQIPICGHFSIFLIKWDQFITLLYENPGLQYNSWAYLRNKNDVLDWAVVDKIVAKSISFVHSLTTWFWILAPKVTSRETSSKVFNLSEPSFTHFGMLIIMPSQQL